MFTVPIFRWTSRFAAMSLIVAGITLVSLETITGQEKSSGQSAVSDSNPLGLPITYIGTLKDAPSSARIAIVVEENTFLAYICSSDAEFNQDHSRWFRGAVKDGTIELTKDGVKLNAKVNHDSIQGSLGKKVSHAFTAQRLTDGSAGLFRAEDKIEDDTYVVGWIIDADENVVGTGAKQKGKTVQTLQPPKPGQPLAAKIGTNLPVQGQRVNSPDAKGEANSSQLSAVERTQILDEAVADAQIMGGNPIQAMILHQMRRMMAKTAPANAVEQKMQVALKKMPAAEMKKFVDSFDRLPKVKRDAIVSPRDTLLPNQPLTSSLVGKLLKQAAEKVAAANTPVPAAAAAGTIKSLKINTLQCIKDDIDFGKDEIFAIYSMTIGDQVFTKTTGILKMETGNTKNWPSGDAAIFAGPTGIPAGEELFVIATVYEDDSLGIVGVLNLLEPLAELALIAYVEAKNGKQTLTELQKVGLKIAVKATVAGIVKTIIATGILTKAIGTDSITVLPNGAIVSDTGGNKTTMDFRRVANGKTRSQYKLLGFVAEVQ